MPASVAQHHSRRAGYPWCGLKTAKKKMNLSKFLSLAAIILTAAGPLLAAEGFHRAHKFETFAVGQWEGSDKSGLLRFGKDFGGGIGVGYNLTDHLNINTDVVFSKVNVTDQGVNLSANTTHISGHVNLDTYLLQGPIAPFLTGGIGVNSFDGSNGAFKISKSELSYKVGAGLRWDLTNSLFAKAVYRTAWADIRNSERFHTVSLMLGVKF